MNRINYRYYVLSLGIFGAGLFGANNPEKSTPSVPVLMSNKILQSRVLGEGTPCAFSPDSKILAIYNWPLPLDERDYSELYRVATGELVRRSYSLFERFSPDGQTVFIYGANKIEMCSVLTGERIYALKKRLFEDLSSNGEVLAVHEYFTPPKPRIMHLLKAKTGEPICTVKGEVFKSFSPDNTMFATLSQDETAIRLRYLSTNEVKRVIPANKFFAFSPDSVLLSIGILNSLRSGYTTYVQKVDSGECMYALDGVFEGFSPDGHLLATTLENHEARASAVRLHNATTGEVVRTIEKAASPVFGPNGMLVVSMTGNKPRVLQLLNAHTGEHIRDFPDAYDPQFSPDGSKLAIRSKDYTIILFDAARSARRKRDRGEISSAVS